MVATRSSSRGSTCTSRSTRPPRSREAARSTAISRSPRARPHQPNPARHKAHRSWHPRPAPRGRPARAPAPSARCSRPRRWPPVAPLRPSPRRRRRPPRSRTRRRRPRRVVPTGRPTAPSRRTRGMRAAERSFRRARAPSACTGCRRAPAPTKVRAAWRCPTSRKDAGAAVAICAPGARNASRPSTAGATPLRARTSAGPCAASPDPRQPVPTPAHACRPPDG